MRAAPWLYSVMIIVLDLRATSATILVDCSGRGEQAGWLAIT